MNSMALALLAIGLASQHAPARAWPAVQPVTRQVRVDFGSERIRIDIPIRSVDGRIVYYFACRGASERYLDSLLAADGG